jgi:uncharacterized membrane protein YbhN (UPF0104 family)
LAVGLLLLLLRDGGWSENLAAMRQIKAVDLALAALFFIISRLAVAWRWHILLRSGGVKIPFKDSLGLTLAGLFASNFLPTTIGGDVVRLGGAMQMGFDRAVCLASIAADRLIGMAGMAMAVPVGVAYSWSFIQSQTGMLALLRFLRKPVDFGRRILITFSIWFKQPGALLASLAFTWLHMLCLFGAIYIFVDDLGPQVSFWMIAGLWSLTYFVTQIPISINGYGLQELSFTFLMTNVAGLSPALSLTVAVLIRVYFVLASLPGAVFMPSILASMATQKDTATVSELFNE